MISGPCHYTIAKYIAAATEFNNYVNASIFREQEIDENNDYGQLVLNNDNSRAKDT